jgi:hypothetical protein
MKKILRLDKAQDERSAHGEFKQSNPERDRHFHQPVRGRTMRRRTANGTLVSPRLLEVTRR